MIFLLCPLRPAPVQGGARAEGDATVQQLLQQRIGELEAAAAAGGADRDLAVRRKKQLRAVAKLAADASLSADDKLLQLQSRLVQQVGGCRYPLT